ncbi:hypothetical protein [Halomonas litopenaei]|uniref:hypothetical protein n=1 Tax=Halomonas litopenaei TaxID=2109328 RepID=UPI001A9000B5|nr:hypothetical protein [Halomonas litopenaei]MBN8410715.1 hypothetical protein [Halomonas litopenaei]
MTIFTDSAAAVDEAVWLAEQEGRPQAIVRCEEGLTVMSYSDAWFERRDILEAISPVEGAA